MQKPITAIPGISEKTRKKAFGGKKREGLNSPECTIVSECVEEEFQSKGEGCPLCSKWLRQ